MATFGYTWLLLLAVCCTGYNTAPTDTTGCVQLLDDQLTALYYGSNSSDSDRHKQLDILMKSHNEDCGPHQESGDGRTPIVYKDCQDAYSKGLTKSDIYKINPDGQTQMEVFCDQASSKGGWIVIQRRVNGMEDFDRTWSDYKEGFGTTDGDYYLGNDNINLITTIRDQKLRVELHHQGHGFAYAEYSSFKVGNEELKYQLHVGPYNGTNFPGDSLTYHNGQFFSTRDQDNDQDGSHCSHWYSSGWWFKNCSKANLNGVYASTSDKGITWTTWLGSTTSLTTVKMMVKPADRDAEATTTSSSTTPTTHPETTSVSNTPTTHPETTSVSRTPTTTEHVTTTSSVPSLKNCQEVYSNGGTTSGVYTISPGGTDEVRVFCEQELQGGGWTVFQNRKDGSVNFTHLWADYKQGFGNAAAEHWLGNDWLHLLTANNDTQLLVELQNDGLTAYAHYSQFSLADENSKYRLQVSGFTNGLNNPGDSLWYHDGMYFSTADRDHDENGGSCAADYRSGWWYKGCSYCNLNAPHGAGYYSWRSWSNHSDYLIASRMMLRTK